MGEYCEFLSLLAQVFIEAKMKGLLERIAIHA